MEVAIENLENSSSGGNSCRDAALETLTHSQNQHKAL